MGRPYSRRLSHKGIELNSLFYNSSELQDLRQQHGATLGVEIRVDEGDIGHIHVIAPDSAQYFRVPALHFEYANGLSSWQHDLFRSKAREWAHENTSTGWLQAKREIIQLVEQDLSGRQKTSHKKHGRFLEDIRRAAKSADAAAGQLTDRVPEPAPIATDTYIETGVAVGEQPVLRRFNRIHQTRARNG